MESSREQDELAGSATNEAGLGMGANYMFAICSSQGLSRNGDARRFVSAVGEKVLRGLLTLAKTNSSNAKSCDDLE